MKKKGAALLVVIIIMMLTFFMAAIMIEVSIKNHRVSNDNLDTTKSYYSAETGVYDALNYIELMAAAGAFTPSYYGSDIPITNLYSSGENNGNGNNYLYGDSNANYTASIRLNNIIGDLNDTDLTKRQYICTIYSKGTYNNQNYLLNHQVSIAYNNGWKYTFISKLTSKD